MFDGCALVGGASAGGIVRTWNAIERQCGFGPCVCPMPSPFGPCPYVTDIGISLVDGHYRISVSPPWVVVTPQVPGEPACKTGAPCVIYDAFATTTLNLRRVDIVTTDLSAPPSNVVIELVPSTVTTCN